MIALIFDWGEVAERGWRVAHTGGVSSGILTLVAGLLVSRLTISERELYLMGRALIISIYGFTLGMWLGALTGERGLLPIGNVANILVFICYVFGVVGSFVGGAVLVKACMQARQGEETITGERVNERAV